MRILLALIFITGIVSCKSKDPAPGVCTAVCETLPHHLSLNYYREQVDTIIVRTFANDGSFTAPVSEEQQFPTEYNTCYTTVKNAFMDFPITTDKNYEIIIPATADTYRVWGMNTEERTVSFTCDNDGRPRPYYCYNKMTLNATLNGNPINAASNQQGSVAKVMFMEFYK